MKCPCLLLIFGVLLPSFYLHCEAFKYHDSHHHGRSLLESENTIDELLHHRYRRDVRLLNDTDCANNSLPCNDTTVKEDHKYYVSEIIKNGQKYWIDVQGNKDHKVHAYLSGSYLLRQTYKLSFQFPYYGHLLDQVMLTTGGFLYMDVHDTRLMTGVQYLAPLMAYFNLRLGNNSKVVTLDDGSKLTVEWYNVRLHDMNATDKPFTFQCTLHKDGTIWFAYKQIPIKVGDIHPLSYHPVKVGIADAFVIKHRDTRRNILFRYFYIYSTIDITKDSVVNNTAVIFRPLLSCVGAQNCTECMERTAQTNFSCEWCTKTEKCSDGADRHRQEWEENKCSQNSIKEVNEVCLYGPKKGCGDAQTCTECMERTAQTNFSCEWCTKTEKCSDGADRHRQECSENSIKEMNEVCFYGPKKGCGDAQTCTECMKRNTQTNFSCEWCTKTEKCTNRADRFRQEWEKNKCSENSIKEMNEVCLHGPTKEERKTNEKTGLGAGATFGIVLLLVFVIGVAAWCVYAYRHPTSKSGLFFIEATRRPREFFRRSPGIRASGTSADPSDVKPQVL